MACSFALQRARIPHCRRCMSSSMREPAMNCCLLARSSSGAAEQVSDPPSAEFAARDAAGPRPVEGRGKRTRAASSDAHNLALPVALIDPTRNNPRHRLRGIEELAASIQAYGLLQPVVVRPAGERYTLVAGHRRLAA